MKKVLIILFLCIFPFCSVWAYELDTSVDAEIKQKYNSTKLSDEMLPQLPSNLKNSATSSQKNTSSTSTKSSQTSQTTQIVNVIKNNNSVYKTGRKIPRWTKFELKSNGKASSWSGLNTVITFTSTTAVIKNSIVIPTGTKFKGNVVNSHTSQLAGNGGLLEIKINSMTYNGKEVPINAVVIKVNGENIFFNRIKGCRQYLTGIKNRIKSATNAYQKGRAASAKLSSNPLGTIIAPIPTIGGFVAGVVGTVTSPVTGLLQKGKDVNIPAGTLYEIKLIEDAYLN